MRLRLFEQTMESINDAVFITDARRRDDPITWVNDTFETLFGYTRDETIGRNFSFLQHGEEDQEGVKEARDAMRRKQPVRTLVRNYRRDGQPLWIQLSLAPVCDSHGRVTHFVGVQHDLTELKRSEEELERRVLSALAATLRDNLRPLDLSGRFGGEEFLVLLPDAGVDEALEVAERLRRAVAGLAIDHEGETILVTISIGVAVSDGEKELDQLIERADKALYRAKHEGRDCVILASPRLPPRRLFTLDSKSSH